MSAAFKCDLCGAFMDNRGNLRTYTQVDGLYVVVQIQTYAGETPAPGGGHLSDLCDACVKRLRRTAAEALNLTANPPTP